MMERVREQHVERARSVAVSGEERSDGLLSRVLNSSHDGIMAFRAVRKNARIVDFEWTVVNPAAERINGRSADHLLGRRLNEEMPGNLTTGLFDEYVKVVETGQTLRLEHTYEQDGLHHRFLTTAVRLDDGFAVTFRDITEQHRLYSALQEQALRDPLTGLANRTLVEDRLAFAISRLNRRPTSVAVLFIDLARFRILNAALGRPLGDDVLKAVAARLDAAARTVDTVGRVTADVFIVLCEELTNDRDAVSVARRFLASLEAPVEVGGHQLTVDANIGLSITSQQSQDVESLLRDAETALFRAKANPGARIEIFDEMLRQDVVDRLDTEVDLRRALATDELVVHYQPIWSLAEQRFVGAEALVRWQHPRRGTLEPEQFLPVAEEAGLLVPIGDHVLRESVRQLARWCSTGPESAPRYVSVNLAAAQLGTPHLVETVRAALAEHGVEPSRLCLEVTETSLIDDPIAAKATLDALADSGTRIALDDFGIGYSSLRYLQQFPVDTIKIDRSFVDTIDRTPDDQALVRAIIGLARSLDLATVVEGVETAAQLDVLSRLGADHFQGYYFGRAQPAGSLSFAARSRQPLT